MWTLLLLTLSVVVDGRCGDTRRRLSGGPVPTRVSALRIRGGSQWPPPAVEQWSAKGAAATPRRVDGWGRPVAAVTPTPHAPTRAAENTWSVDAHPLDELLDRNSRVVFVRRVYGLLSLQLAISSMACVACASRPDLVYAVLAQPLGQVALALAAGVGFAAPLALTFSRKARRDPKWSLPLFAAFALAESAVLGVCCTRYRLSSVLLALAQTGGATAALTAYGFQPNPKYDLTGMGSALVASLLVLIVSGFVGVLLKVPPNQLLMSTLGSIIMSLFIVHDTQLIVGGKHRKAQLDTKDYVMGAMTLYLDIANLFLMLLRLFGEANND